jgi:hypothetical protein
MVNVSLDTSVTVAFIPLAMYSSTPGFNWDATSWPTFDFWSSTTSCGFHSPQPASNDTPCTSCPMSMSLTRSCKPGRYSLACLYCTSCINKTWECSSPAGRQPWHVFSESRQIFCFCLLHMVFHFCQLICGVTMKHSHQYLSDYEWQKNYCFGEDSIIVQCSMIKFASKVQCQPLTQMTSHSGL